MSQWSKIIEAVKDPVTLGALGLLVLMVVLKQVLTRIEPIGGRRGFKLAKWVVNAITLVALFLLVGAIGYKFYELQQSSALQARRIEYRENVELSRLQTSPSKPALTRIDIERLLQQNRSSLEACLSPKEQTLYLDFVVADGSDGQLGVDVFEGVKIGFADTHPFTLRAGIYPRSNFPLESVMDSKTLKDVRGDVYFVTGDEDVFPEVTAAAARKMSVVHPKTNGCILGLIRDSLFTFAPPAQPFTHRYITNKGTLASREYRSAVFEKLRFEVAEGRCDEAEQIGKEATLSGYTVSLDAILASCRKNRLLMKQGKISKEEFEAQVDRLFGEHTVQ